MKVIGRWDTTDDDDPAHWKYEVYVWVDGKGPYLYRRHGKLGEARETEQNVSRLMGVKAQVGMRIKKMRGRDNLGLRTVRGGQ